MKRRGISLIILIITIIVVIILAAVVILTLSKNNPIESAKEARFKEDVRTFQDELALTVSKQYTTAGGHRDAKITTSKFDEIKEYIPSFSEKYKDKFIIQDDELVYTKQLDDIEKEYAQSLNVNKRISILPDEYQQVEYIESTGNQYIDTKYIATNQTGFFFDGVILSDNSTLNYNAGLLGSGTLNWETAFVVYAKLNNSTNFEVVFGNREAYKCKLSYDKRLTIEMKNRLLTKTDGSTEFIKDYYPSTDSLLLFNFRVSDSTDYCSFAKVYKFDIYENENLLRNFIPCYSTTTVTNVDGILVPVNTKGLYDTVEGKFYTNQGTGEDFIPGPDVD